MKNKELLIWGISLWIGGGILGNILKFIAEVSRSTPTKVILFILVFCLAIGAIAGFVMTIVAIVKMIRDRNPRVARNIRVARKVR